MWDVKQPENYKEYIHSYKWQEKRESALECAGRKCQVCNSIEDLQVHHKTYERFGNESDSDLIVLCRPCHLIFHDRQEIDNDEFEMLDPRFKKFREFCQTGELNQVV